MMKSWGIDVRQNVCKRPNKGNTATYPMVLHFYYSFSPRIYMQNITENLYNDRKQTTFDPTIQTLENSYLILSFYNILADIYKNVLKKRIWCAIVVQVSFSFSILQN